MPSLRSARLNAPARKRLHSLRARMKTYATPLPFSIDLFRRLDEGVYKLREAVLGVEAAKHRSDDDGKRSPVETY